MGTFVVLVGICGMLRKLWNMNVVVRVNVEHILCVPYVRKDMKRKIKTSKFWINEKCGHICVWRALTRSFAITLLRDKCCNCGDRYEACITCPKVK